MTPKEISRRADRIFVHRIPSCWAVRDQQDQEDYGIDYEIELIDPTDYPTGFIFKVQQKGALRHRRTATGDHLTYSLPTTKLQYHLCQLDIPSVLVLVDVQEERAYWAPLQINRPLEKALRDALDAGQQSITIHVPTANELRATADVLLRAVSDSMKAILVRNVRNVSSGGFVRAAAEHLDLDTVAESVRRHHEALRCEQIQQLIGREEFDEAQDLAQRILDSPAESLDARFAAGVDIERIAVGVARLKGDHAAVERHAGLRHEIANRLLALVRVPGAPQHLRVYARFLMRAARLRLAVERDFGLFLNWRINEQSGDAFWKEILRFARTQAANEVVPHLRKAQHCVVLMIKRAHLSVLAESWARLAGDLAPFVSRLRYEELNESADSIISWLDAVGTIAVDVSRRQKNWADMGLCAVVTAQLARPGDPVSLSERLNRASEIVSLIEDEEQRRAALEFLAEFEATVSQGPPPMTVEHEAAIVQKMAAALGHDVSEPADPVSEIINIGLRDLNPERVLKNCQHLFVSLGSHGLPGEWLGLPTAGSKWLQCVKFGYAIGGMQLDGIYETFYDQHCKGCSHCLPHPEGWKWTREWQQEQDEKFRDLAERVNRF